MFFPTFFLPKGPNFGTLGNKNLNSQTRLGIKSGIYIKLSPIHLEKGTKG